MPFSSTALFTLTKGNSMTKNATLRLYLNGVRNDNLLTEKIKDGDLALISYGTENETQTKSQLDSLK